LAWDLAVSTHEFYNLQGYLDDWQETHLHVLAACRQAGDRRGEAAILTVLGQPAITASRRPGVSDVPDLERAVALFEAENDQHGLAIARRTLGNALRRDGEFSRAADELRAASRGFEACADAVGQWQALRCIGQTHLDLNEYQDAVRDLSRAADLAAQIRLPRLIGQSAYWLGRAHLQAGDLSQARDQFAIVLTAVGETDPIGRAYAYLGLGEVAAAEPNGANEADQHLREALELAEQGGDAVIEGRVLHAIALRHRAAREEAAAMISFERAIACFQDAHAHYLEQRAQADRDSGEHGHTSER
jgi:tetratricopeptide (TPR) repeat protein